MTLADDLMGEEWSTRDTVVLFLVGLPFLGALLLLWVLHRFGL